MIQDILEETKKFVWPEIDKYLKDPEYPGQFRIPNKFSKDTGYYWKINRVYPERKGKYIRPTLLRLVAESLGAGKKSYLKAAAAMQLSEEWLLIHDDIQDTSDIRRGGPTLHKLYGENLAINAGDALNTVMWKIINDIGVKSITDEFYKILMRTILGQAVEQMLVEKDCKSFSIDECLFINDGKSSYYSITGPMRLGGIVGGARQNQIEKISDFGFHLGRCFQLVDDILDIKQDKKEGKITLATSKGEKFTRALAVKEMKKAKDIFNKELNFLSKEPARSKLKELIDFILERDY